MTEETARSDLGSSGDVWHELDVVLEEIGGLSKSDCSVSEFLEECLSRVVQSLGAAGGAVWTRSASGEFQPGPQLLPREVRKSPEEGYDWRRQLVSEVDREGKARSVLPQEAASVTDSAENSTALSIIYSPWSLEEETLGVFEIFHRSGASPKTQRAYLELVQVVCGLVEDFYRRGQLSQYRRWAADWHALQNFAVEVHRSLDLRETAFTVANESCRLLGCDRVSVLVRKGRRYRLVAASGVARVNERSNTVVDLERLAAAQGVMAQALWYPDMAEELAPELEQLVSTHLDHSHARALLVQPLGVKKSDTDEDDGIVVGALVAENYYGCFEERTCRNLPSVVDASAVALGNALELSEVPFLRPLRRIAASFGVGRVPAAVVVLLATVASGLLLAMVPASFQVEARGELQPVHVRDAYAPVNGVVSETFFRDGDRIEAGDVLLRLQSSELDFEFSRIWGELQTARQELSAVEAERAQDRRERGDDPGHRSQLTARREELGARIDSLQQQYAVLQTQRSELEVRSPITGHLLTWNLQELLDTRPVNRGQTLATVGDLEGPWQVELRIPDRRVAHVLAARDSRTEALPVRFIVATDPSRRLDGELTWVGSRTEISDLDGAFVPARVAIRRVELPEHVPGAAVTAKVDCGRHALGYVWFHDLWDAIRSWILF